MYSFAWITINHCWWLHTGSRPPIIHVSCFIWCWWCWDCICYCSWTPRWPWWLFFHQLPQHKRSVCATNSSNGPISVEETCTSYHSWVDFCFVELGTRCYTRISVGKRKRFVSFRYLAIIRSWIEFHKIVISVPLQLFRGGNHS